MARGHRRSTWAGQTTSSLPITCPAGRRQANARLLAEGRREAEACRPTRVRGARALDRWAVARLHVTGRQGRSARPLRAGDPARPRRAGRPRHHAQPHGRQLRRACNRRRTRRRRRPQQPGVPRSDADTLGRAFASMLDDLNGLVGDVSATAATLTEASEQMATTPEEAGRDRGDRPGGVPRRAGRRAPGPRSRGGKHATTGRGLARLPARRRRAPGRPPRRPSRPARWPARASRPVARPRRRCTRSARRRAR